jgi:hypothetical protein
MTLSELPRNFVATRETVHRVATHVLARRRHAISGKFGLRATPGGIGTPAFGPEHEVVRITGVLLVRERTGEVSRAASLDLSSATLADAAALVDVDLSAGFEVGHATPELKDPGAPLAIDAEAANALAEWLRYAWAVLDAALAALGPDADPSVIQLWPEHFDAAFDVAVAPQRRTHLGASPGDAPFAHPYLYVGPWGAERPGDASYWNAPFGAVLSHDELRAHDNPVATGARFLLRGVDLLRS